MVILRDHIPTPYLLDFTHKVKKKKMVGLTILIKQFHHTASTCFSYHLLPLELVQLADYYCPCRAEPHSQKQTLTVS